MMHQSVFAGRMGRGRWLLVGCASLCALALIAIAFGTLFAPAKASGGTAVGGTSAILYLSPSSMTVSPGQTFTVDVHVATNADAVDALKADIAYPASMLQYVGTSVNSQTWGTTASSTESGGVVDIEVGSSTPVSGDAVLATLTFAAVAPGDASLSLVPSSATADATTNTEILGNTSDGVYTISGGGASAPPANLTAPQISGAATEGHVLSEVNGTWTNSPGSYTYQWENCDSSGYACSAIAAATSQTYTLAPSDVGHTIRVEETASNGAGSNSPSSSPATGVVQLPAPTMPTNISPPVLAGRTTAGGTLTSSTGAWSGDVPISYSYSWTRCVSTCSSILGAAGSSYTLSSADVGAKIVVLVTAINSGGSASASTAQLGPVAPPRPTTGRVGTLGAKLKFTFACQGAGGQSCHGRATASTIEKLSANGKTITGVLARKPRTGRYRVVTIAKGNFSTSTGTSKDVSIGLNSTGQMLRNKFKNVPSDVRVTATAAGRTTTIKTAKVTFGPDPPKVAIAGTPTTKRGSVTVNLRCRGLNTQVCRGAVTLTTFEKLSAKGKTITGLASAPSGKGKLVTIAAGGWSIKAGKTLALVIGLNATGKSLLSKFVKIPATLKVTPTYNGYTLTATATRITLKR
jgi:hypothetical protein